MTYRRTQRNIIRYRLYRGHQVMLCASTSVRSKSRLNGACRGTTLGKTGSGCIVLARTSRRSLPEHRLWGCGCQFAVRSGMETSRLAKTVRRVLRYVYSALGASDECGMAVFKGDSLPWTVGRYEILYHHDKRYNVLALEGPIEIYGTFSVFCVLLRRCMNRYPSGPTSKSRL